jgi:hypothetical protein
MVSQVRAVVDSSYVVLQRQFVGSNYAVDLAAEKDVAADADMIAGIGMVVAPLAVAVMEALEVPN